METEYSSSNNNVKGALGLIFEYHSKMVTASTNTLMKCSSNENMK